MKNDISTEERIDNYILGKMSDPERMQFESELRLDIELRAEYEAQKEVANGVQRIALRAFLEECEKERSAKPSIEIISLRQTVRKILKKAQEYFSSTKRLAWSLSVVAAMAVAVVGIPQYVSMSNMLQSSSLVAYAQTTVPEARDGNELDFLLQSAYASIGTNQLDAAETQLNRANALIQEECSSLKDSEEDEYHRQILQIKQQDTEWYSAIILMKKGKVVKAKKALKAIAENEGVHSKEAQEILDEIYHSK